MKEKIDYVNDWILYADEDLKSAQQLLQVEEPIPRNICFLCQQSVEKYIKACLIYRDMDFPKSHEIGELIELIKELDNELSEIKEEADNLTPYAVMTRYPSTSSSPSIEDAKDAFNTAIKVQKLVKEKVL